MADDTNTMKSEVPPPARTLIVEDLALALALPPAAKRWNMVLSSRKDVDLLSNPKHQQDGPAGHRGAA